MELVAYCYLVTGRFRSLVAQPYGILIKLEFVLSDGLCVTARYLGFKPAHSIETHQASRAAPNGYNPASHNEATGCVHILFKRGMARTLLSYSTNSGVDRSLVQMNLQVPVESMAVLSRAVDAEKVSRRFRKRASAPPSVCAEALILSKLGGANGQCQDEAHARLLLPSQPQDQEDITNHIATASPLPHAVRLWHLYLPENRMPVHVPAHPTSRQQPSS